ncbi:MarR family winged helix-turn-helix transcriptional regulator [Nonomuraea sp. NPDC005983]|uniref:MarR family winged helix-turn-helix transcriptional regulator n=1 Tax=Nonomuraea sp. NPDC005983 TaxID=3155595 RepID=UPI0033B07BCA
MIGDRPGLALAYSGQIANVRIKKAMAQHGLKPPHGHVLLLLSEQGATSQQSLAETLGVDPSVLVAVLNDLEGDELAVRRRDPADRRRHIVEISARGKQLVADVQAALAVVEATLFADLDADEIATLHRLLARVSTSPDDAACTED